MITVCAFVDMVGTSLATPEQEYEEIKDELERILDQKILFKPKIRPWDLSQEPCDCYVIDYGGLGAGCNDTMFSMFKTVLEIVLERPNTLFIIWSWFSEEYYKEVVEEENPEFTSSNVIFRSDDKEIFQKELRTWFGIGGDEGREERCHT